MTPPAARAALLAELAEVFREHGYDGASLARIEARTGLGKGSLYHAFPGGKAEMARAVLGGIDAWFQAEVFAPLAEAADPLEGIARMLRAVETYFASGRRVCLAGAFALGDARDPFANELAAYFTAWRAALAGALRRAGAEPAAAEARAEDALATIQGALVLARALKDPAAFGRALRRLARRLGRGQRRGRSGATIGA